MNALELAQSLSAKFFAAGNYESLGAPAGQGLDKTFAAAASNRIDDLFETEEGFAGLAVQSVGFTSGAEQEKVVIYVTRGSQRALKTLPTEVDGVPVTAHVMGRLKAGPRLAMAAGGSSYFFERGGRVACGSSTAPSAEQYAGTFGALATSAQGMFALSNNHVFAACNHTPMLMPLVAPAAMDTRPGRRAPTQIAVFASMIELRSGALGLVPPMEADFGLGVVAQPEVVSSWQGDDAEGYDTPPVVRQPAAGMKVKKFGRTTGLTHGTVEALVPTPWMLPYKSTHFSADVWFQNTWTIRSEDGDPFALPGDSGSLLVTEDGAAAVGLIFAVNTKGGYAIACELGPALARMGNLSLVSGHGI